MISSKCFAIFCFYNEIWFLISFHYNSWFPSFTIEHAGFFTNGLNLPVVLNDGHNAWLDSVGSSVFFQCNFHHLLLIWFLTFLVCMVELTSMFDHTSVESTWLIHHLECFFFPALQSMGLDQNPKLLLTYS